MQFCNLSFKNHSRVPERHRTAPSGVIQLRKHEFWQAFWKHGHFISKIPSSSMNSMRQWIPFFHHGLNSKCLSNEILLCFIKQAWSQGLDYRLLGLQVLFFEFSGGYEDFGGRVRRFGGLCPLAIPGHNPKKGGVPHPSRPDRRSPSSLSQRLGIKFTWIKLAPRFFCFGRQFSIFFYGDGSKR